MKALRFIYAYRALDDFILIYPLYALLFASRGLTPFQISLLLIIWAATAILVEVPSGVLADRYSRKALLVTGQLIRAVGYSFWIFMPNFTGFAIGFIGWGIGGALASGTFQALVYDELKKDGQEKRYAKVIGTAESLAMTGMLIATALASVAVPYGYKTILVLSIVAVLASALAIAFVPEVKRVKKVDEETYFSALKRGIQQALHDRFIRKIILLGAFIGAAYGSLEEYFPLFFSALGFTESTVPLLVALTAIAAVVASITAYRFEGVREHIFVALLLITGLLLATSGILKGMPGVLLVVLFTLLIHALSVIYDARLQHGIKSDLRATITSVGGFLTDVAAITMMLIFGAIAERYDYTGGFVAAGIGIAVIALFFFGHSRGVFKVNKPG